VPLDHAACVRPQQADGHLHLWFEHDPIGKPVPTFPDHAVFPLNGMRKVCEHGVMVSSATTSSARGIAIMLCVILLAIASGASVRAEGCLLPQQGEGCVADVVDGRSVHLADGREILLAGIEPAASEATRADRAAALSAVTADHDVTLRGEDDTPDRYGPQPAFGLSRRFRNPSPGVPAGARRGAGIGRDRRQGLRGGSRGAGGPTRYLGKPLRPP
jgi:hypothetical protein